MSSREQSAFSEKNGLNKGAWTPAEDKRLTAYVQKHGHKNWRVVPKMAGLARCGKSCRLRWINYLRPGLKHGNLSKREEETLIRLHRELGNKWSKIAGHLPGRTDNEIKNIWNTHFKKRFGPKESMPSRKKPKEVTIALQTSDAASVTGSKPIRNIDCCTEEDSSDEKTNLDEYLDDINFQLWPLDCISNETSNEKTNILIDLDESLLPEDDFEVWPTSVDCTFNENSNILIELEEFLESEDFEIAGNDCETSSSIASWQMAMHEDGNNHHHQAISSPSVSLCSNASTANNNGFNTELKNVDVLITELDECLKAMSADQFEVLGINDCQISSSSGVSAQMDCWDLDLMMDEMEAVAAIGSEFWSVLDDDGDCYSASTTMSLDQEESSSARVGEDNGVVRRGRPTTQ